jgi:hypothetical protein
MRVLRVVLVMCVSALPLVGQGPVRGAPFGMQWRADRGVPLDSLALQRMPPGWHVTTGPGVVLFDSTARASGRYTVSAGFYRFPVRVDAPYGLVVGSTRIADPFAQAISVLLRGDGSATVVRHGADGVSVLVPWMRHTAIRPAVADSVIYNRVQVRVDPDSVRIFVNDSAVVAITASRLPTESQFGLRVGDGMNMHIESLDLTRHFAPPRAPAPARP